MVFLKDLTIEFTPREVQHSEYDWADISKGDERVGKVRTKIENDSIPIFSILIYPDWSGHGIGKCFVDYCKEHYSKIIADRVRHTAIGFWEKTGFKNNNDGTWIFIK